MTTCSQILLAPGSAPVQALRRPRQPTGCHAGPKSPGPFANGSWIPWQENLAPKGERHGPEHPAWKQEPAEPHAGACAGTTLPAQFQCPYCAGFALRQSGVASPPFAVAKTMSPPTNIPAAAELARDQWQPPAGACR